jgi:hypothetical protein
MSVATPPPNSQPPAPKPGADPSAPAKQGEAGGAAFEAKVQGESLYDRVTSMLMAAVVGAAMVVGLLMLIYWTNQAFASRVTAPLEIVEVYGGGGGTPEGTVGSTEKIDVPGGEYGTAASNNEEEASAFEEPQVMATPSVTLDAVAEPGQAVVEADFGPSMPTGGSVASGRRSSKLGTGGPGYGFGPGDGGVPPEQRWSIIYPEGQPEADYARQLDSLGVELGTPSGSVLVYGSRFSSANPTRRTGVPDADKRIFFLPRSQSRRAADVAMLRRAGIEVREGSPIFQFYPEEVVNTLRRLEVSYKGRQPIEIRVTRFKVVPQGGGFGFEVLDQQTLR